ncbi:DUF721 domain-containing protein [Allostreptomyces psammosilenae]|uniref:UPF0232 protein FHU37_002343 n=1 Tax=Allostreptomyces psammosilenae TaxID=1892865 RepID=A0A852ZVX0_9ACTN|nr:DciA family protein [Allostreptomyces psammosilenae]NYI05400.1 putative nucleic acid-binding Zn ribbon protein [Allostreptomyces psammosilenae]
MPTGAEHHERAGAAPIHTPTGPHTPAAPVHTPAAGAEPRAHAQSPAEPRPSGVDLARVALRAAKEQARLRGEQNAQRREARRGRGLRSGSRPDGRDPQPLGAALQRLIAERGWETPVAVSGVMSRWPEIVGRDIAQHCVPEHYSEEERAVTVRCDSSSWATQLRYLAPQLVARLNAELGHGTVRLIKVQGPEGPPRRYGRLRVR